jgi:hypothetical protein
MQVADTILMVRPAAFCFNKETAANNYFQNDIALSQKQLQQKALYEFDSMVKVLRKHEIEVLVVDDTTEPIKPDAIFPNNWFNTSNSGIINIFPMFAISRRTEKRDDILDLLSKTYIVNDVLDWTEFEANNMFLEGTGSLVIDHKNAVLYACLSPRRHKNVIEKFAHPNKYRAIVFTAKDVKGKLVYHTNVMMCIGDGFAVVCLDAIENEIEKIVVSQLLKSTGHEIIPISLPQMNCFAGNMLQVKNKKDEKFIVVSQTAFNSLETEQKNRLQHFGVLLPIDVSTIEKVEGGSVRCMMAEIFLQPKD